MARNNRIELLDRLAEAAWRSITRCRILEPQAGRSRCRSEGDEPRRSRVGDALVFATGTRPELSAWQPSRRAALPYTRIGDCNVPGDFLTRSRDASMVALSIE
jgi:hypothetical protein